MNWLDLCVLVLVILPDVVIEELVQIKFIKFFAWESKWIERVLDARQVEMQWLVKCEHDQHLFSRLVLIYP
jgi:hypothetical protein